MRETAILGILGIATLGFFVDSALADIRLDRAMFLIAVTAALNIWVSISCPAAFGATCA
jgi:phosphonate transport system permease protein